MVLHEFPIAANERLVAFAAMAKAALPTDEIEVSRPGDRAALEHGHEADRVEVVRRDRAGEFHKRGKQVEDQPGVIRAGAALGLAGPTDHEWHPQSAVVMFLLAAAPRVVVLRVRQRAAVVRGEDNHGVAGQARVVERGEHPPDSGVEMLDKRDVARALFLHLRRALLHFCQPFGGRLHREMGRVVGEIEEERLIRGLRPPAQIGGRPVGKQIGGVAYRLDHLVVTAHVVVAVAQMRRVAVHHVAEKPVEVGEAALVRRVGRFKTEVPLADDGGVIARAAEHIRQGRDLWIEVSPGVPWIGADDSRHPDPIRIAAREQGRPRWRANGAVRPHRGEEHALGGDPVDVGRAHVRHTIGRDIAITVVVGENQQEIGAFGSGAADGWKEQRQNRDRTVEKSDCGAGAHGEREKSFKTGPRVIACATGFHPAGGGRPLPWGPRFRRRTRPSAAGSPTGARHFRCDR